MCLRCSTRRDFLQFAALAAGGLATTLRAQSDPPGFSIRRLFERRPRAGAAAWARLHTRYPGWQLHAPQDIQVTNLLIDHGLPLEQTTYAVDPADGEALRAFPLIFANHLTLVQDPQSVGNLREYLYGGGFLYLDVCAAPAITPYFESYYQSHRVFFERLLPEAQVLKLPASHAIFRTLFPIEEEELNADWVANSRWGHLRPAIWGLFDDDRMMALFSMENFRCNWTSPHADVRRRRMQQAANVHAYALLAQKFPA